MIFSPYRYDHICLILEWNPDLYVYQTPMVPHHVQNVKKTGPGITQKSFWMDRHLHRSTQTQTLLILRYSSSENWWGWKKKHYTCITLFASNISIIETLHTKRWCIFNILIIRNPKLPFNFIHMKLYSASSTYQIYLASFQQHRYI